MPLLVLLMALNNKVLVANEVSYSVRLSTADNGDVGPKALYPATSSSRPDASRGNHTYKQFPASSKKPPICLEWNEHPGPGCPHPSC